MNALRKACLERTLTCGAWMQIGHPAVAEIFGRAGFQWVCVDLEHGAIDLSQMTDIFRTLAAFGCTPVVRTPVNDPVWIRRSLDAGAQGVIVPMVKSAAEARAAVDAAKYPPLGTRGFGYSRANMHGMDFTAYIEGANDEIPLIMQIEHKDAIPELDAILEVEGVDGLFVGPLDLSGSMGLTGQLEHPKVVAALHRYIEACQAHRKAAGMHLVRPTPEGIRHHLDQGYTLIALGLDNVFLDEGSRRALDAAGISRPEV